jgi:outer membrane protein assembly factor BamB
MTIFRPAVRLLTFSALLVDASVWAGDWPVYRHDALGTSNANETLTASDARTLGVKWRASMPYGAIANPIVVGDTVYVTGGNGYLRAINAATGAERWSHSSRLPGTFHCTPSTAVSPVGAPAVVGDTVFMSGGDGFVYSHDAGNGAVRWRTQIANVPERGEFLWSSIFPAGNRIYVGIASLNDCLLVPGRVVALDQASGQVVGSWWADPQHQPGGGVWTQPAQDPLSGRIFITTGTVADGRDPREQPLAQAFVAFDPISMETLDHFQPVPAPFAVDADFGGSPVLYTTPDGRHLVAATNKDGFVYALNRDNLAAGVVWSRQISGNYGDPDLGLSTIVSPAFANDTLFVGGTRTHDGHSGAMVALNGATGSVRWLVHPRPPLFILAAPTVAGETVIFAATKTLAQRHPSKLYVLDQRDGTVLFSIEAPGSLFSEPTFSNGVVYFADLDDSLWALVPGGAVSFSISGLPDSVDAGQELRVSAIARDSQGNLARVYLGNARLRSSDPIAVLPTSATFVNGVAAEFPVTFRTAGAQTLTVSDVSIAGSARTAVRPGPVEQFAIGVPGSVGACDAFPLSVRAVDAFGNTVSSYNEIVALSSSDALAELPANQRLSNGVLENLSVTLKTLGSQTLTVRQVNNPSFARTANTRVGVGNTARYEVSALGSLSYQGVPASFTLIAKDRCGNNTPAYGGTARFTSSDPNADLPANAIFSNGLIERVRVTFRSLGVQSISAIDVNNGLITGSANTTVTGVDPPEVELRVPSPADSHAGGCSATSGSVGPLAVLAALVIAAHLRRSIGTIPRIRPSSPYTVPSILKAPRGTGKEDWANGNNCGRSRESGTSSNTRRGTRAPR